MKHKFIRVPTQVHTRELDRSVAHKNIERAGIKKVNKNHSMVYQNPFGATVKIDNGSYFSNHWRDYVNTPTIDLRRKSK